MLKLTLLFRWNFRLFCWTFIQIFRLAMHSERQVGHYQWCLAVWCYSTSSVVRIYSVVLKMTFATRWLNKKRIRERRKMFWSEVFYSTQCFYQLLYLHQAVQSIVTSSSLVFTTHLNRTHAKQNYRKQKLVYSLWLCIKSILYCYLFIYLLNKLLSAIVINTVKYHMVCNKD